MFLQTFSMGSYAGPLKKKKAKKKKHELGEPTQGQLYFWAQW